MKIIRFLKTDVKIINSYFLIAVILIILISVGYFSYALFSFTKTSNNIIELTVGELKKADLNDLIKLADNKNDSGLYTITHNADSTLQIGATESITEYRYRGANPKNYVNFNNETWRIIGIFPTDDGTGNIENRIKLIRNEIVVYKYWSSSTSTYNNWTGATLKIELNGTYLSSLSSEAQGMIGDTKYYLGGYNGWVSGQGITQTPVQMYSYERKISGSSYYYGTNPNSWTGKIALMYVSDYGYASDACESKMLRSSTSSTNDLRACNTTNWLYKGATEWLLPQIASNIRKVFIVDTSGGGGGVDDASINNSEYGARPVLYLKSGAQIISGDGTKSNPYKFLTN